MKPDELREIVATMRELGVTECGTIKLGPPPPPTREILSADEEARREKERRLRAEERQRDIQFAASHVRPALRAAK
jgi:hypothetical protein